VHSIHAQATLLAEGAGRTQEEQQDEGTNRQDLPLRIQRCDVVQRRWMPQCTNASRRGGLLGLPARTTHGWPGDEDG